MVNITIDFKNNKIYLRRPYIKGGVYNLSLDSRDPLAKLIHEDVTRLLSKGLDALASITKTLYAKNEYVQYDYNARKQSGFFKLIKDGKEIIHLSIFTGENSTPHLTFKNTEGEKIHLFVANLELNDFNSNKHINYQNIFKKYNEFKDLKSICKLFCDLLNLIKVKFNSINYKPEISDYKIQILQYINSFINIFENPRINKLRDGIEKNVNATLENMINDNTFIEITNREITEKTAIIQTFIKENNSLISGLVSIIDTVIEKESLTDIFNKISEYKTHNSYPITDKEYTFPIYRIFESKASIDIFIKEFEKIKKLVESIEITDSKIILDYNTILANIANINFLFNPETNKKLSIILDIEKTDRQLTSKEAKSLSKFIETCSKKSTLLHKKLNKTKAIQTATTSQNPESTVVKTKPATDVKTKPATDVKTKPATDVKTKPATGGKIKTKTPIKRRTNSTTPKKK